MARTVRRLAAVALVAWAVAGCYDVPQPPCGFACGPSFACPDDYVCITGRCVLESAVSTASCLYPDGGVPIDGSDAPPPDTNMPPEITVRVPAEFADDVLVGTTITVTFSEPVLNVTTSSFRIDEIFGAGPLTGSLTQPDATTYVLTPSQPLRKGVTHIVTLDSQISDLDGAILPFTQWNFRTEPDLDPPSIAAQIPAPNATGFAIDGQISVRFNEEVTGLDQTTFTLRDSSGIEVAGFVTFDRASNTALFHNNEGVLRPNETYTVRLSGAIMDIGGNPLPNAPVSWTFTTGPDTIRPMLISQSPAADATGVNIASNLAAWFDEDVIGVSSSTFVLRQGATVIPATVTYVPTSQQVTLDPTPLLASGTMYTLTLEPGITDAAGNVLVDAPITWSFTTAVDLMSPSLIGRTPAFGATNVPLSTIVTVTFNEDVKNVSNATFTISPGGGVITYNSSTRVATLVPAPAFMPGTLYTVGVTAGIQDLSNNPLGNPQTWTFTTTLDATAPTVMMTSPANNATAVATTTPIVVLFDEPVTNVTGLTFTVSAGGGVGGTITSGMMGREWTFSPSIALPAGTLVTVSLTSGITDATSNPLAPTSFSFVTAP